tara:strand:- start:4815 stop:5297 length:483 start_codon:yes stop_codon:yes gene_type:complete
MITITQKTDSISIENYQNLSALEISYRGFIVGEVLGNTITGMNNKKIIIGFLSDPQEILIKYYGDFAIKSIKAYSKNNKLIKVKRIVESDEIGHILSKWDESTNTYDSYNKSNKYSEKSKSLLSTTLNNVKRYIGVKGQIPENKLKLNQKKSLNRIRSIK